jgi:hypothetical protein
MECQKCYVYVHDTISRPFKCSHINHERALRNGHHLFAAELVRIASGEEDDPQFLAILFAESGGVSRTCCQRNPFLLANTWIQHQLRQIGNLGMIHMEHSPELKVATIDPPSSPLGLRIRIPDPRIYGDLYA